MEAQVRGHRRQTSRVMSAIFLLCTGLTTTAIVLAFVTKICKLPVSVRGVSNVHGAAPLRMLSGMLPIARSDEHTIQLVVPPTPPPQDFGNIESPSHPGGIDQLAATLPPPLHAPPGPLPQQPSLPAQQPSLPAQQPSLPAHQPSLHAQQPSLHAQQPSLPVQQPSLPAQQPLESQRQNAIVEKVPDHPPQHLKALADQASPQLTGAQPHPPASSAVVAKPAQRSEKTTGLGEFRVSINRSTAKNKCTYPNIDPSKNVSCLLFFSSLEGVQCHNTPESCDNALVNRLQKMTKCYRAIIWLSIFLVITGATFFYVVAEGSLRKMMFQIYGAGMGVISNFCLLMTLCVGRGIGSQAQKVAAANAKDLLQSIGTIAIGIEQNNFRENSITALSIAAILGYSLTLWSGLKSRPSHMNRHSYVQTQNQPSNPPAPPELEELQKLSVNYYEE